MPKDKATASTIIDASADVVLAAIRDVSSQAVWLKEMTSVELTEEYEDGTPATAIFEVITGIGADRYTLAYEHTDDGMSWTMVEGKLQKAQDGAYVLRSVDAGHTEVTLTLEVDHSIPAPGFLRKKIFNTVVQSTLVGLKGFVES